MKKETQAELIDKLLSYAMAVYACAEHENLETQTRMIEEMKINLQLTFKIGRRRKITPTMNLLVTEFLKKKTSSLE